MQQTRIYKEYNQPFMLEPTKLGRVMDLVHERLNEHHNIVVRDQFDVFLSGNRHEVMTTIDEVLASDNDRKHRIQRILVASSAMTPRAAGPDHEVRVDFGGRSITASGSTSSKVVSVAVRSSKPTWATRTMSEVEEQVERTWLRQWLLAVLGAATLLIGALLFLLVEFVPREPRPTGDLVRTMWLRNADLHRVEQLLAEQPLTEAAAREVVSMQLRNVLADQRRKELPRGVSKRRVMLVGLPLAGILVSGAILLLTCYPSAVFLWGQEVERYERTLRRRQAIWNFIIFVMGGGVLANLLSLALAAGGS